MIQRKVQKVTRPTPAAHRLHSALALAALAAMTVAVMAGCNGDSLQSSDPAGIVVEGWIDSGRFPVVTLTRPIVVTGKYQSLEQLESYLVRWARVTVSDGEREVVLTGHKDKFYYPPYVYTTTEMRGEPGKTYRLTVDCTDGTHAEAVTTIPQPATIDSFRIAGTATSDTLRQLYAYINDPRTEDRKYKLFTHVLGAPYGYRSAYLGLTRTDLLPPSGEISVNRGRLYSAQHFTPYFTTGSSVVVKLAHIGDDAYRYWRAFEDMADLSRNPLFPVTNNLEGNVKGGLGYWFGYGATYYRVTIK